MDTSTLFSKKRKSKEVTVPDVGTVTVKGIGIPQRLEIEKLSKEGGPTYTALLICACTFDAEGNPIFTMDDAAVIDGLEFSAVSDLAFAAHEINGTAATSAEDAKKNS